MPVVIKIGGAPARDPDVLTTFARELALLSSEPRDARFVIVHGGGAEVTDLSHRLGLEASFRDGVRLTSAEEMPVVEMVLCGLVNKRLVRALSTEGVASVGLSGADGRLLTGLPIAPDGSSFTATVQNVNAAILETMWSGGWLPVIASPGSTSDGIPVNINADEAALAIGRQVGAGCIAFLSDVDGVLDDSGVRVPEIRTDSIDRLVSTGTVRGGMVAKLRSAAAAVEAGVKTVVIGSYEKSGDLAALVAGARGTTIRGAKS